MPTSSSHPAALLRAAPLAALLLAFTLLALAYGRATPLGEAPDEPTHVQYVLFLRENGRLPQVLGRPDGLPQGKHPPLYYLLGALTTAGSRFETIGFVRNRHFSHKLDDPSVAGYFVHRDLDGPVDERDAAGRRAVALLRLVSLLSGLVVVGATWWLGRLLWSDERTLAVAAAAMAAFLPGYVFFSGVFNNDTLASAWVALALVLAVRLVQGHADRRDLAALGVVLGLGLITKLTTLPAFGFAGLAVLAHAWRSRAEQTPLRFLMRAALWIGVPATALSGWWLVRNMRLYGWKDPLGTRAWSQSIGHSLREIPFSEEIGTYLWIQFTTFWGRFGWGSVPLPKPLYMGLLVVCALACTGLLVLFTLRRGVLSADQRWSLGLVAAAVGLLYAAVFRLGLQFDLIVAHGRYLYPALPGLAVLFVAGLLGPLPARVRGGGALLLAASMAAFAFGTWRGVVRDAFAAPAPEGPETIAAAEWPLDVVFDGRMRLVGVSLAGAPRGADALAAQRIETPQGEITLDDDQIAALRSGAQGTWSVLDVPRIAPGTSVTATLFWRSERDFWDEAIIDEGGGVVARDDVAFAHLLDADREVVARIDEIPFDGAWPTMAWPIGATYAQHLVLRIPADAHAGEASLLVGLYEHGAPDLRFPTSGDGGGSAFLLDDALSLGPWLLTDPVAHFDGPQSMRASFTDREGTGQVGLLDAGARVEDGEVVVDLVWTAFGAPTRDARIFVHVVQADATGDVGESEMGDTSESGTSTGTVDALSESRRSIARAGDAAPVAQADGNALDGRLPLALWPPLQPVHDTRRLSLPAGLAPGRYIVRVGLYEPDSGQRWRIDDVDSGRVGSAVGDRDDDVDGDVDGDTGVGSSPGDGALDIGEIVLP